MLLLHFGRFADHHGGWWWLGSLIPVLLLFAVIGLAVWAVLRVTSRGGSPTVATGPAGLPTRRDPAMEELRLRYARGEMSREEFVTRSRDLMGMEREPGAPPPIEAE